MRFICVWLVLLVIDLGVGAAHVGEVQYRILGLPTAHSVDLKFDDGSVADWWDVLGEPSIEILSACSADTLAVVWLAWNSEFQRIYGAVEHIRHLESLEDVKGRESPSLSVGIMVDGDHSGEGDSLTSQSYLATLGADGTLAIEPLAAGAEWSAGETFARGGGAVITDSSSIRTLMEFYITSFDTLSTSGPDESVLSDLQWGKTIGLNLWFSSMATGNGEIPHSFADPVGRWQDSDLALDLLLDGAPGPIVDCFFEPCGPGPVGTHIIECELDDPVPTATPHHSWGLIKSY